MPFNSKIIHSNKCVVVYVNDFQVLFNIISWLAVVISEVKCNFYANNGWVA